MKLLRGLPLILWVLILTYLSIKIADPFGVFFQGMIYLLLLLTGLLFFQLGWFSTKRKQKLVKIISVIPFLLSAAIVIITSLIIFDYRLLLPGISSKPTSDLWKLDYESLKTQLKLHPAFKDSLTDSYFSDSTPDFDALTDDQALIELMKLAGRLPDGHTFVHPLQPCVRAKYFPLLGYWFEDGYYITRVSQEYDFLRGKRIVGINGTRIPDILTKINTLTGPENHWQGLSQFDQFVFSANVLHGLNIIDNNDECVLNYLNNEGKEETATLRADSFINWFFWALKPLDPDQSSQALMNLRKPNYQIQFDSANGIVIVSLHLIQNESKFSIKQLAQKLTLSLQKKPEKVVFDLRNSLGGNNELYTPLIEALQTNLSAKVYVFTSRKTFSASVNFISELKRAVPIILVGEPTGAGPNHYGDADHCLLPATGISVFISTRKWVFDSLDHRKRYEPDIFVPYTFQDFQKEVDPCLAAISSN
jgi:hypothetical protein